MDMVTVAWGITVSSFPGLGATLSLSTIEIMIEKGSSSPSSTNVMNSNLPVSLVVKYGKNAFLKNLTVTPSIGMPNSSITVPLTL